VQERIPIYLAAIGPKNTALAGEIADGWIPTLFSPEHVSELRPLLQEGAERSGKSLDHFDIAPTVSLCITDDLAAGRDTMRPFIALYVGGMGSRKQNFYNQLIQRYGYHAEAQTIQDLYLEGKRDEAMAAIPDALIDTVSLCGPPDVIRERLAVYRDAGVGTLGITPTAFTAQERLQQLRLLAELAAGPEGAPVASDRAGGQPARARARPPRRVLLGAFGDPGHAFPMIALGRALVARGHHVTLQTWRRWQEHVRAEGIDFAPAPEYQVFPSGAPGSPPLDFYEAVVHATADTLPLMRELQPHVVVADILTLAPALAAEIDQRPCATLIPHVHPHGPPDFPIYSLGARLPSTAVGRALWRQGQRAVDRGLERGRVELNQTRSRLGLPALGYVHGGISRQLALVATFPQLEYPRTTGGSADGSHGGWPANTHVVGPLMWEPPANDVELPSGAAGVRPDAPLVLIAPSTAQDAEHTLLRAALRGLAHAPVRVLATYNRRLPPRPLPVPANARVVDWVSYARTMPHCDIVVCHAGHGTLVRALASGCAVVACPAVGDMNENAARVDWAGAGVRVPRRFVTPRVLGLAVERALGEPAIRARAREFAAWAGGHDAGAAAAVLVEGLATRHEPNLVG
jgi:UDP:flavonoid glycosyltransferase YjiC (YdhE family)